MKTLTLLEFTVLSAIKKESDFAADKHFPKQTDRLVELGLVKKEDGLLTPVKGQSYAYRGTTYIL